MKTPEMKPKIWDIHCVVLITAGCVYFSLSSHLEELGTYAWGGPDERTGLSSELQPHYQFTQLFKVLL